MKFITGKDRSQAEFFCLDQAIGQDNEIRLIDVFVDALKLEDFGFRLSFIENGRPAYHPSVLLKLYIYGYLNRIRSSRALEKECKRNLELMWLVKGLAPDHNTIANFRKDNPAAIRKVFRATVQLAKNFNLIGGVLLAGDSTKLRAQNSKKNNYNPAKIERHIKYIDAKLDEYNAVIAREDQDPIDPKTKKEIKSKIRKHKLQRNKYESLQQQIDETGETQVSTSDPDSRQLITRNNITEVAYNIQTTVDAKHNIPIDFKVTNQNDSKAMGAMVRRAKTILGSTDFVAIYDKGYHTGSEFNYANKQGIKVIVAIPDVASHAPDHAYDVEHFVYDKTSDSYTCPQGDRLISNGKWYTKSRGKSFNKIRHFKTTECLSCPAFSKCTVNKKGRCLERSEHADLIHENKQRMMVDFETYRRRQAIVEHPYGIIKRQWDFYYIMTKKTMKHASADVGLIFTAFNLRRILNLINPEKLKEHLSRLVIDFWLFRLNLKSINRFLFLDMFWRCSNISLRKLA